MSITYPIIGKPRNYAWGGKQFIPKLFKLKNQNNETFAEWWLGAHPDNSATLIDENGVACDFLDWLKTNKWVQDSSERDIEYPLPFLMKVLDVNEMLAIQVHPTKQQALDGFARQDAEGIERSAPERTYRDRNDKPEMMVALTSSWLAHGFTHANTIIQRLTRYPFFYDLTEQQKIKGTQSAFEFLMHAKQEVIDELMMPLVNTLEKRSLKEPLLLNEPEYWIHKAYFTDNSGYDRGLLALFFMNIVNVLPGHGIYQDAGIPHAYLSGQNVELMANSDNVVRIGPTKLHVDIPELLPLIRYDVVQPHILEPINDKYQTGVSHYIHNGSNAFDLKRIEMINNHQTTLFSAPFLSLFLVVEGSITTQNNNQEVIYSAGDSFVLPCNTRLELMSNNCVAYIASYGGSPT